MLSPLSSPVSSAHRRPGSKGCLQPATRGVKSSPSPPQRSSPPEPLQRQSRQERAQMRAPHPTAALPSEGLEILPGPSLGAARPSRPVPLHAAPGHCDTQTVPAPHRATQLELWASPPLRAVTNTSLQPVPNGELLRYVEPLLNCDPLEASSMPPAPTTYMPCCPFTSTLFPFFSYKHSFGGQPGRSCFPPLLPTACLLWGRLRSGPESGVEPSTTQPGSPSTAPRQEAGIGSLAAGTRWGPKMPGAGPTRYASLQGVPQPGGRSRGVPPSTGDAQTSQHRSCCCSPDPAPLRWL